MGLNKAKKAKVSGQLSENTIKAALSSTKKPKMPGS